MLRMVRTVKKCVNFRPICRQNFIHIPVKSIHIRFFIVSASHPRLVRYHNKLIALSLIHIFSK